MARPYMPEDFDSATNSVPPPVNEVRPVTDGATFPTLPQITGSVISGHRLEGLTPQEVAILNNQPVLGTALSSSRTITPRTGQAARAGGTAVLPASYLQDPYKFSFRNISKSYAGPAQFYENNRVATDKWLLPVPPAEFSVSVPGSPNMVTTISGHTYTHAGNIELDEISFSAFLPFLTSTNLNSSDSAWPVYIPSYTRSNSNTEGRYHTPQQWINRLSAAFKSNQPFEFSIYSAASDNIYGPYTMTISAFNWRQGGLGGHHRDVEFDLTLKHWKEQRLGSFLWSMNNRQPRDSNSNDTTTGGSPTGNGTNVKLPEYAVVTVRAGDTLSKIAQKHLGSAHRWRSIYELNKTVIGANPNKIYPGQKLKLPRR